MFRRRSTQLLLSIILILGGLSLAVLAGATPPYEANSLVRSGSFFALASSGDTLYAASDNGGSILLEQSSDRGVHWTPNPVPYSAVAGGSPWDHAAVAVDGRHLVLAAASGGSPGYPVPVGAYSPGPTMPPFWNPCGTNSTILLAASPDGGRTWSTSTFTTQNLSVTSLQSAVEGNLGAVAWLGVSTACTVPTGLVSAVTSTDAGHSWTLPQNLSSGSANVRVGEGIEMAAENHGIMVGFGRTPNGNGGDALSLWQFSGGVGAGFSRVAELPAPASWTLQGDPGTPAYLLTPTYLIPLTSLPYTAIPFDQLQLDGGVIGELPHVVSLVPSSPGVVEIAATASDSLGVDCWQVDTVSFQVSQTCHVSLAPSIFPSSGVLPIVALIDGGGWWIAIGASGDSCTPYCTGPPNPGGISGAPTAGPAAVGTSVCVTGCSSAQGLASYSYSPGRSAVEPILRAAAVALSGLGVLGMVGLAWVERRRMLSFGGFGSSAASVPMLSGHAKERRTIQRAYLVSLGVWTVAWLPLALVAFFDGSDPSLAGLPVLILFGAAVGACIGFLFHHTVRARLLATSGLTSRDFLASPGLQPADAAIDRVRTTHYFAYASWVVAFGVVLLTGIVLIGRANTARAGGVTGSPPLGPDAFLLAAAVLGFVILRILYHIGLAATTAAAPSDSSGPPVAPDGRRSRMRTYLGAALLPWNPLVGGIMGLALQPIMAGSPYLLAWAFLPVTLLGGALLAGGFGRTTWSTGAPSA